MSCLVLALLTGACVGNTGATTTSTGDTTTTSEPSTPTSTLPPVVECPGPGEFGEGGGIAEVDGEGSDASHLGQVSWEESDQCESFVFAFETSEGAPATTVPNIAIDHLASLQVLRISMDIDGTVITDQLVETGLVDRLYVVQALDGEMFVDLHLGAPAAARIRVESSPAMLTVDLRPGFLEFEGAASIDDGTVVVSPSAGSEVEAETTFTGYTRAFESNVVVIVTQGEELITETNTTAAEVGETWGAFSVDVTLPPGDASVFVGEASPDDGSLDGVTLDLSVN